MEQSPRAFRLLFDVATNDALTSSGVVVVGFVVALLASLVPARAGSAVDPVKALRVAERSSRSEESTAVNSRITRIVADCAS
jgi:hypothetical protein